MFVFNLPFFLRHTGFPMLPACIVKLELCESYTVEMEIRVIAFFGTAEMLTFFIFKEGSF